MVNLLIGELHSFDTKLKDHLHLIAGQILFEKGDEGGDLYFIQEGEIEIFSGINDQETLLATMKKGEVIGLPTFLTQTPRMANARAATDAVIRKISRNTIKGQIQGLPSWLKAVIKDLTYRLDSMNMSYSTIKSEADSLKKSQITYPYIAGQICTIANASKEMLCRENNNKYVGDDNFRKFMAKAVNINESLLLEILGILQDSGLLSVTTHKESNYKFISIEALSRLETYVDFISKIDEGNAPDILYAKPRSRELKIIKAMISFAKRNDMALDSICKFQLKDLKTSLRKIYNVEFSVEDLAASVESGLIELIENYSEVRFTPNETILNIMTYTIHTKLERLELKHSKNK